MKKIIILGAGVTGLSMAQLLKKEADVLVIEKDNRIGGLAKTKQVEGATYHMVGGHCFNSKHSEILDFVFDLLPKEHWHNTKRYSTINLGEYEVGYPIEYAMKQIFSHNPQLAQEITRDFLSADDDGTYTDLEQWFRKKFGNKLSELYFLPYNQKIWGRAPKEMSHEWVQDKLPIPDKASFFASLMQPQTDTMSHAHFYYPNTNDQQTLLDTLAKDIKVVLNEPVTHIGKTETGWTVNKRFEADMVISTLPLNLLPSYLEDTPQMILDKAKLLKYNRVSNVFWESRLTEKTWTYQPGKDSLFHRYIHIGSFFSPARGFTITEAVGEHDFEEMVNCGKKDPFLLRPLDYNVSDHAYVVFDEHRTGAVDAIQAYLKNIGLISIGRFGQWEYFNMDVCMKQSWDTYQNIKKLL